MLTAEGVSELICLTCPQHEEADTRIFVHAAYSVSNQGCARVVIKAIDTDIAVLGVYHSQRMPGLKELWIQKSVTAQNPDIPTSVFLPWHQITDVLSSKYPEVDITSVVLAAYTIIGCDTVSYPFRIGKKQTLKCALENRAVLETITKYGEPDGCLQPMQEVLQSIRRFYFALYGRHDYSWTLLCTGTFHYQERRSSFIAVHRGCLHTSRSESFTSAGDIQTSHSTWPIAPKCSGIWMISPRWLPTRKKNNKTSKTLHWKTYCKCKNGKCGDKCPCHCAGPECNIGCLCSGDPLKCNRFTIEWHAFLCLNVSHRLV